MRIRKARVKDLKKIANIRRKSFNLILSKNYTKKQIESINKKNTNKKLLGKIKGRDMFCLVDKGKIIGIVDLEENKIGGLFLDIKELKKGYGKKLMEFIENYAKKKKIKEVYLYSTTYAYPFYKKLNYKDVKKFNAGKDMAKIRIIHMKKNLK